ncbi:Uncharacterised protein [Vibrio cholerae]|uniref:Uncharacterized protein n=1 Tax=Vibrio cholerae TaxID=666 RepID=A0A655Y8A4_VIBCL|nr:Uncharacterised protein [Vibrio cholerae]
MLLLFVVIRVATRLHNAQVEVELACFLHHAVVDRQPVRIFKMRVKRTEFFRRSRWQCREQQKCRNQ